jgi:hypothetical protein
VRDRVHRGCRPRFPHFPFWSGESGKKKTASRYETDPDTDGRINQRHHVRFRKLQTIFSAPVVAKKKISRDEFNSLKQDLRLGGPVKIVDDFN